MFTNLGTMIWSIVVSYTLKKYKNSLQMFEHFFTFQVLMVLAVDAQGQTLLSCSLTKNIHCFNETTYQLCITSAQQVIPIGQVRNCASGTICSETVGSFMYV